MEDTLPACRPSSLALPAVSILAVICLSYCFAASPEPSFWLSSQPWPPTWQWLPAFLQSSVSEWLPSPPSPSLPRLQQALHPFPCMLMAQLHLHILKPLSTFHLQLDLRSWIRLFQVAPVMNSRALTQFPLETLGLYQEILWFGSLPACKYIWDRSQSTRGSPPGIYCAEV